MMISLPEEQKEIDRIKKKRRSIWVKDPDTDLTEEIVQRPPRKLMLSLNSACNLRCKHCMRSLQPTLEGKPMARALLETIIERILPHTVAVRLGGNDYGEQLLGENFGVFMDALLAMENRSDLELVTNGLLMTEEKAHLLVQADTHITLSIEGMETEYTRVRGRPWQDFIRSVNMLAQAKDTLPGNEAEITLYVCATFDALDSIREMVRNPPEGVDSIRVRHFYTHHYRKAMQSLFYNQSLSNRFFEELRFLAKISGISLHTPKPFAFHHLDEKSTMFLGHETAPRLPCHKPFELISILSDGSVYPCCGVAPKLGIFIPAMDSIEPIWNGPAFCHMRRIVNTETARLDCKRCEDVQTEPGAFMIGFGTRLIKEIPTRSTRSLREKFRDLLRRGFEKAGGAIKRFELCFLGTKTPF
jgi:MoaA/NifB/PqqE/SkfB family radical SAM enzyme